MKTAGIIGGGIAGLATALYLARGGVQATLFEKNDHVGGKLSIYAKDRFTFDLGPTVLTMPFVLQQLAEDMGEPLERYLMLHKVEPTCRYHWNDGTVFDAYSNSERFWGEIARIFPNDIAGARTLLGNAETVYNATKDIFLFNRFNGVRELFRLRNAQLLPLLSRAGFTSTVAKSVRKVIVSDKLAQFFMRFATYNGSSPYKAPATLNVIPHVELAYGAWYPEGGMYTIVEAMLTLARNMGVRIETGVTVEGVVRKGAEVTHIDVAEKRCPFDIVVSNADALWTYEHLLQPVGIQAPKTLVAAERSCSGFLMLAAVKGEHPHLAHHNIFFSDDYPGEFRDIFVRKRLPRQMTIYVSVASNGVADYAPPGHESWYVLVNAPASGTEHKDKDIAEKYAESIWQRLKSFGLQPDVLWQKFMTPLDIEQRYNSRDGAIYGTSSNSPLSAFLRPTNKVQGLGNMYMAGGSTHPGGGIPLAILSGRLTAEQILKEHGR